MKDTSNKITWIEAERRGDEIYSQVIGNPSFGLDQLDMSGYLFIAALKDAGTSRASEHDLMRLNRKVWRYYRKSNQFGCGVAERELKTGLQLLSKTQFSEDADIQMERARLYLERAYCAMDSKQVNLAQNFADQALEILRLPLLSNRNDGALESGRALQIMAFVRRENGDRDGFSELMQDALLSFKTSGDTASEVDHELNLAQEHLLWGNSSEVKAYFEQNIERISAQAPSRLPKAMLHLTLAYLDCKEYETAVNTALQTVESLKNSNDIIDQALAYEALAEAYKELALASKNPQIFLEFSTQTVTAMSRGLGILQKHPAVLEKKTLQSFQYQLHRMQAELALADDNLTRAHEELDKADRIHSQYKLDIDPDAIGDVRRVFAWLYKLEGKIQSALSTLDEVRELYASNELEGKVISTDIARSELQFQLGQGDSAKTSLINALSLAGKLNRDWDVREIKTKLDSLVSRSSDSRPDTSETTSVKSSQTKLLWPTERIRQMLIEGFNDSDLVVLCFDHFKSVYEDFTDGMTKGQKVQLLLDYCTRQSEIEQLLVAAKKANPWQFDRFASLNLDSLK
jgi:tetratricopeptide (TPR) repeat protein